ncbi:MAG: YncE family protein [Candidatus Firestonebacteria bacterium]|nr:YncE family protein [Candidatus Firestonebacteria bacterium]
MRRLWITCLGVGVCGSWLACTPAEIKPTTGGPEPGTLPSSSGVRVLDRVRVGFNPIGVAVTPDGQFVYTADSTSQTVTKVSTATRRAVSTIQLNVHPVWLAVAPLHGWLCVTARDEHNLTLLDLTGNYVVASLDLPYNPEQVIVNREETLAYISNHNAPFITVVDLQHRNVAQNLSVGGTGQGLALTLDGKALLMTLQNEQFNFIAVSTVDQAVLGRTNAGSAPTTIVLDPAGVYAYVANQNSNDVSIVHLPTVHTVVTFPVGRSPVDMKISPSGKYLFVSLKGDNRMAVVDTVSRQVVQTVDLDITPWGLGLAPDGKTAYVADYDVRSVYQEAFNASQPNMTLGNSATRRVDNNALLVISTEIFP